MNTAASSSFFLLILCIITSVLVGVYWQDVKTVVFPERIIVPEVEVKPIDVSLALSPTSANIPIPPQIPTDTKISGRYVRLQKDVVGCLLVAEIRIYDSNGINVAPISSLSSSSGNTNINHLTDGRYDTNVGGCSEKGWMEIDLRSDVRISNIVVVNRTDCCQSDINDSYLTILDSSRTQIFKTDNIKDSPLAVVCSPPDKSWGEPEEKFNNISGRFVRIEHGTEPCMNLAQLEITDASGQKVMLTGDNMSMSSIYDSVNSHPVSNLVDGNPDTFAHTSCEPNQWMEADLKSNVKISKIIIQNRKDCCQFRIVGSIVRILDENRREVFASRPIIDGTMSHVLSIPFTSWVSS